VTGDATTALGHDRAAVIFVTDSHVDLGLTIEIVRAAASALPSRRLVVQLRDKENGPVVIRTAAQALRDVTREVDALFVVNGATSIAHEVGADGAHLPWDRGGALAARIASARRLLGEHIYALGGVTGANASSCAAAGADGVAVIRAFYDAGPLGAAIAARALLAPFDAGR
jgi:thiamine monophosphate synthase